MWGYRAREVAKMLGLSVDQVRSYVRAGCLGSRRGPRGELRFSFQDLVLLRAASGLMSARVPGHRVRRALRKLREQLPDGRPLAGIHIAADGDRIVVRDGDALWQPESGQVLFDFQASGLARRVAPLVERAPAPVEGEGGLSAEGWYQWACDLEEAAPEQAREGYRRALELSPEHADAHVNLGRMLHEAGDAPGAERHYRRALAARSEDATAAFNLGVALEDQRKAQEAIDAYERAVAIDPGCADAHFNAARLCEQVGRREAALRHLGAYRRLTRG